VAERAPVVQVPVEAAVGQGVQQQLAEHVAGDIPAGSEVLLTQHDRGVSSLDDRLRGLQDVLGKKGVKFTIVCPGYVDTPMLNHFPEDFITDISPARPEEVADQILQLIFVPQGLEKRKGLFWSAVKKGVQWMTSKK